jgi:hypothetical protein
MDEAEIIIPAPLNSFRSWEQKVCLHVHPPFDCLRHRKLLRAPIQPAGFATPCLTVMLASAVWELPKAVCRASGYH